MSVVDQVDLGHGQIGAGRQVGNNVKEFRGGRPVNLTGTLHAQNHLVGVPIGKEVCACRKQEGEHHAALATYEIANGKEEAG